MLPVYFLFAQQQSNPLISFLPFIAIFVIFYLLLILPQQKKQKAHQRMISELNKGDRVITSSGIYGSVANVKDHIISLVIADGIKIDIQKSHIAGKVTTVDKIEKT